MKGLSLGRAFRQIGSLTAVSRIMGFMRDIAFAAFLGAGGAADAFLVALKLPNMFRRLSAEGCLLYTSPSPRDPSISRMPSSA